MKKSSLFIITAIVAIMGTLFACNENVFDESTGNTPNDGGEGNESGFKEIQLNVSIDKDDLPDGTQLSGLKILTLDGEVNPGSNGKGRVVIYEGEMPQIIMLTDANDELLLMARGSFKEGESKELSARSTAIALVTMHPALSGTKSHVYKQLEELVTGSPSFNELEETIAESVRSGCSFTDTGNAVLTTVLNKVFEQVVATGEDELVGGELPYDDPGEIEFDYTYTRAVQPEGSTTIAGINVGPFNVTTSGSTVYFMNYALTPLYSGTISHHGTEENFDIPSGEDRGIGFYFDNTENSNTASYTFQQEGEYQFYFDKNTAESYLDQSRHSVCCVLDVLGLPLDREWIMKTATDMVRFMTARGMDITSLLTNPDTTPWDVVKTVGLGAVDYIKEGYLEKILVQMGAKQVLAQMTQTVVKKLMGLYTLYQACNGGINAVMRITLRIDSPDIVSFGLYYYQGKITSATKASLKIYSGNGQEGLIGRRLNEPVCVKVTTTGSDGSELLASNFHKVKFVAEADNGTVREEIVSTDPFGYAQTHWTLDQKNTGIQYLKATVIDIVTNEEISETVTFSATPLKAADVTFRLDWNPTDADCDIDLHIYDPDGHHIFFGNMCCECGGELDRDDIHGPGPEHIYYAQAKPGKYRVYVNHFYSNSQGTVGFTVTTEYNDRIYVNRSSVAYEEMAYIGTLEVTGNSGTGASRAAAEETVTRFYYEENVPVITTAQLPRKAR